jgi:protein disulfide-isomerase A1
MVFKVCLALIMIVSAAEIAAEDDVWVLTDNNFRQALNLQPDLLVEFYAPWCAHCKNLAPEYSKAAKRLLKNTPSIRIAKVDCTVNVILSHQYQITSYPTIKYFINKNPIDYDGDRTEDEIVSWVLKKNTPALSVISSLYQLQEFLENHKLTVVLFSLANSSEAKMIEQISKGKHLAFFVIFDDVQSFSYYEARENSLVLFKQFDDKRVDFYGKFIEGDVLKFIEDNRLPVVLSFNEEAVDLIFIKSAPALFLFTETYEDQKEVFETLGYELKGVLRLCKVNSYNSGNLRLKEHFGIASTDQPAFLIFDPRARSQKFKFSGEFSLENLRNFVRLWLARKLEVYLKSQDLPAQSFENGVQVLVGKNFEGLVYDSTKDVLVMFYAPWCENSKALAPEYEELAQKVKSIPSLMIGKLDATANDVLGIEINNFPLLKFYPANNKKGIDFSGNKDFQGLLKFVTENSFFKFDSSKKVDL